MTENLNNKLTFIDLFAGCGGLSLGLEQAGFYPLYVNELNSDALETYLINRDQEHPHLRKKYHSADIKKVVLQDGYFDSLLSDFKKDFNRDFREDSVDLVAGGPPCQGYSGIGIRRSYSVDKKQLPSNHLYEDMAYVVNQVNPKMFLFENVEGLLRARWTKEGSKGEIFKDVLKTFKNLTNYTVKFKLVKAKDYGVPQNRPRVLVIGVRKDIKVKSNSALDALEGGFLPKPTNDYPNLEDVLSDLVDEGFEYGGESVSYNKKPSNSIQESYRTDIHSGTLMKKGHVLTEMEYSKHSDKVVERFSHMIKNKGQIPEHLKTKKFAQRLLPRKWGEKGPTITVTSLPDDFVHYSQARCPTVREWARLQAFPDWYQFAGKRTTGGIRRAGNPRESNFEREVPKYTQIGNAVPVKLAFEVGKHFNKLLSQ
jgi:DNA (cytosine-5)-methyltransferase 1